MHVYIHTHTCMRACMYVCTRFCLLHSGKHAVCNMSSNFPCMRYLQLSTCHRTWLWPCFFLHSVYCASPIPSPATLICFPVSRVQIASSVLLVHDVLVPQVFPVALIESGGYAAHSCARTCRYACPHCPGNMSIHASINVCANS